MRYSVQQGFVVLDENTNVVDWFDTEEDAIAAAEEMEEDGDVT